MDDLKLLRISFRVASRFRRAKTVTVEVPYAKGVDMWKLEQKGRLPSATKEAIIEIVRGHGGKHPRYEEDGLFFDVPADRADSAVEDIENLHRIDKAFKSLFDVKEVLKRTLPKERKKPERKPTRAEKEAERLLAELDRDLGAPSFDPEPRVHEGPARKPEPAQRATEPSSGPKSKSEPPAAKPARKPVPRPEPKTKTKPELEPAKPGRRVFTPSDRPKRSPASYGEVMESINKLRRTVRDDDEDAFMDAVRSFLDTIDYESWA